MTIQECFTTQTNDKLGLFCKGAFKLQQNGFIRKKVCDTKTETLRKRFQSYEEIQFPIIDYYIKNGLCEEIKTEGTRDENILKINTLMKSKNLLP